MGWFKDAFDFVGDKVGDVVGFIGGADKKAKRAQEKAYEAAIEEQTSIIEKLLPTKTSTGSGGGAVGMKSGFDLTDWGTPAPYLVFIGAPVFLLIMVLMFRPRKGKK